MPKPKEKIRIWNGYQKRSSGLHFSVGRYVLERLGLPKDTELKATVTIEPPNRIIFTVEKYEVQQDNPNQ